MAKSPKSRGAQVVEPVRSRCLCVRVAAPSHDQICQMISHIAEEEDLEVPPELMQRLAKVPRRQFM